MQGLLRPASKVLAFAVVCALSVSFVFAEDDKGHSGEKRWMAMLGAVAECAPEYTGSDTWEWGVKPLIVAKYHWPKVTAYIEGTEAGFEYSPIDRVPLILVGGLALGFTRDESIDPALAGTGDVKNPFEGFTEIAYGPDFISLHVRGRYAPISRGDEKTNLAVLSDIYAESVIVAIPLILKSEAGITVMDDVWSSALYGGTGGVEAAYLSIRPMIMLSQRFGLYFQGRATLLLGDAASSAVTTRDTQYSGRIGAFVRL